MGGLDNKFADLKALKIETWNKKDDEELEKVLTLLNNESDAYQQQLEEVQQSNMEIFEKCLTLTALTTPHTMRETKATAPNFTDQKLLFLDIHNVLGQSNQTEGGINTETKDGKGQILHCNYCEYKTEKLKPSKALQRLNAHAFRHRENSPKNDDMGINITGLDEVHMETAKDSDIISIKKMPQLRTYR